MIRAVLDTNVLVSGIVRRHPDAPSVRLIEGWRAGVFQLIVCEEILDEVRRTLGKPYFRARLSSTQVDRALLLLRRHASITPLTATVQGVASHPEDDVVLDAAVSAEADVLITADAGLLALATFQAVSILSPRAFVERLQEADAW